MKILPLGFESMGVRSMCTYVETDQKILIDPGTALAPLRFKLPPSYEELITLKRIRSSINTRAKESNIITISHYHHDHFTPFEDNIYLESKIEDAKILYSGKKVFLKNPHQNINQNQKKRAKKLIANLKILPGCEIIYSEGEANSKSFKCGETELTFSPALPHGKKGSPLGTVVALSIDYNGQKMMHASDVQGPISKNGLEYILKESPDILILSGPPHYLKGYILSEEDFIKSLQNLKEIGNQIPQIIVDHHLLRNDDGLKIIKTLNRNISGKLIPASQLINKKPLLLESQRKKLSIKNSNI
ncbi:MAG: MBL fold metallo-hydrolase [Euryarchaeota archaeon]|nr:MBL fold metallo-hydrolase [Euryarchaeota archaeon]MBV1755517.1 MBL fold metallo-hydrolase [Methanobacterium sp.]